MLITLVVVTVTVDVYNVKIWQVTQYYFLTVLLLMWDVLFGQILKGLLQHQMVYILPLTILHKVVTILQLAMV